MIRKKPLVVAILATAGFGLQANAQVLEEIIVTSQKRMQSMQDVPITMSTLSGEELATTGIDSQRSLAQTTPNVAVNANANYVAPYIRGVGTQYANPGLEPSVATYFNDLYLSRASSGMMSFFDIERVEVLKGPQGTLYGRNTTGGAIRVITKDPTPDFEAGVAVDYGNYSKKKGDAFISGALSENLLGRLSMSYEKRDGYVRNIAGGPDMEDRDQYMIHGKLLWEASDRMTVKFDFDWMEKEDNEGTAFQALFEDLPGQVALDPPALLGLPKGVVQKKHYDIASEVPAHSPKNKLEVGGAQVRVDYDFDTFTFSSITGYRTNEFRGRADLDGSSLHLIDGHTTGERTKDYSQEFQLVSDTGGQIEWVAGIYYLKEDASSGFAVTGEMIDLEAGMPNAFVGGDGTIEIESIAPYGQISYHFNDEWELMVGARYTDEKKRVDNDFYLTMWEGEKRQPVKPYLHEENASGKFKFSKTTPKVMLTWRPLDRHMYYVSYSEGVKSGGFNMPHPAEGVPVKVKNETIKSLELGWKTEFDRLRFNGSVFHYKLENLQLQVTDPSGGVTVVRNAGEADVNGIEFDVTYAATHNLELAAGAGYQKAEFDKIPNGQYNPRCADIFDATTGTYVGDLDGTCYFTNGLGVASAVTELKGNKLPHAPELTGYLRANYYLPLGGDLGELTFTGLVSYSDEFYYTGDNLYKEPSKTLANASVSWRSASGMYLVSAYVTNLTDKEYNTHKAPYAGTGGWKVPGQPRMYGLRLAINFN